MRICKLHLQNIGVFDGEEIEFQPCEPGQAEIHILTGPNGSGKTTILLTLAELFNGVGGGMQLGGRGYISYAQYNHQNKLINKRFRYITDYNPYTPKSFATIISTIKEDKQTRQASTTISGQAGLVQSTTMFPLDRYRSFMSFDTPPLQPMDFFAFAHAGYRYIGNTSIEAVKELKENPLKGALDFIKENSSEHINQWVANSLFKSAYEERKNGAKAARFAQALHSLEMAISAIVGYTIEFDVQTDPLLLTIKANDQELDFDVLPDGLRSLISWMGDLLMRVDSLKWADDLPAFEKNLILFLDEIEVHLHPAWQRKVLPVVQKLFKNSQIFLSTHSPFVVNSVDGAWVYELDFKENGSAYVKEIRESKSSNSIQNVLRTVFDVTQQYGGEAQQELEDWQAQRDAILEGRKTDKEEFLKLARKLAGRGLELNGQVEFELLQLSNLTGENYEL